MHKTWITLLVIFCMLGLIPIAKAKAADREQAIKAVYLYNFLNYITWPQGQTQNKNSSVALCIYGKDPFDGALTYIKKKADKKFKLLIRNIDKLNPDNISSCHILYVSILSGKGPNDFGDNFNYTGVLTVSDIPGFAEKAGIIELVKNNDRIKLIINSRRLRSSGLKASSKLMKIAVILQKGE